MRSIPLTKLPGRSIPAREAFLFLLPFLLHAQQGGFLEGAVHDKSGAAIREARVTIENIATGAKQRISTDASGEYGSTELPPGQYRISVRSDGFRSVTAHGVPVAAGKTEEANFIMDLLPLTQEVTVETSLSSDNPAASGISVVRKSQAANLPANGRDLHAIYQLIPGAVLTPAASTDGGQFSVAGQRPNTNTFRVDGMSGNTGTGISGVPGSFPGATLPGLTVIGSTQEMVAKEEIERIDVRSSNFAPEFGDRPGAQVLVETRAGANDLHADIFGYFRPSLLDSPDWFADRYKQPLGPASLGGYGASLGGAILPGRTFFFTDFEGEHLDDAAAQLMPTPSYLARSSAPVTYRPLLDLFPSPTASSLNPEESVALVQTTNSAGLRNLALRLDQTLGTKARLFFRLSAAPSHDVTNHLGFSGVQFQSESETLGATAQFGNWIHDLRANYSDAHASTSWWTTGAGAGNALNSFPGFLEPSSPGVNAFSIPGMGQVAVGYGAGTRQRQAELRYTVQKQFRLHDFRAGLDVTTIVPWPTSTLFVPTTSVIASSFSNLLAGDALGVTETSGRSTSGNATSLIGSAFVQDTYRLTPRLTLMYGLRWELTPRTDSAFYSDLDFGRWNGPGTSVDTWNPSLVLNSYASKPSNWPERYTQFAPRLAVAYNLSPNLVFRAGAGLFYDDALGSLLNPLNLSPLNSWEFSPNMRTNPSGSIDQAPKLLFLPQAWEWRASLERKLSSRATLSASYLGSTADHLLREEGWLLPDSDILGSLTFASSGRSSYQALELQARGDITPRFYALASYTWAHSIDTGSQDGAVFLAGPGFGPNTDRGSSTFDIRHTLTASVGWRPRWLKGLVLSASATARTGFPFDVTTLDRTIGLGFANSARADLIYGVPLWIVNPAAPGGRELNPAAFRAPEAGLTGTLGRDALRGPGLFQLDASISREFRVRERVSIQFNCSVFNLFNRATFANPVGYLGSPFFGQAVNMQNLMLGSGTPNSGLTPLFQAGGPRTVELGMKITF